MRSARQIRNLLQSLYDMGVFINYEINYYHGQSVTVRDDYGRPFTMSLSSAKAYARIIDEQLWGF